jgi:hypothetical protein
MQIQLECNQFTEKPIPPKLNDFGLSPESIKYLSAHKDESFSISGCLPLILSWTSFLLLWVLVFDRFVKEYRPGIIGFLLLPFLFAPGLLVGGITNKLLAHRSNIIRENNDDYIKYRHYQSACEEYEKTIRQYQLAEQKRREAEQLDEARKRRAELDEKRKELKWWMDLDGSGFEHELAELLKSRDYDVTHRGRAGDEGVDLALFKEGKHIIVQCKAFKQYISPGIVRDLYGTLIHQKADEAWLVTTSGFHRGSIAFAKDKPIKLLTIAELLNKRDF